MIRVTDFGSQGGPESKDLEEFFFTGASAICWGLQKRPNEDQHVADVTSL